MAIATSMRELTDNIARSHEERTGAIGEIDTQVEAMREGAQGVIRNFHRQRESASSQLRKVLAKDTSELKSAIKTFLKDADQDMMDVLSHRKKASAALRKDLASGQSRLKSEIGELRQDFKNLIVGLGTARGEARQRLIKDLAESRAGIRDGVGQMRNQFRKAQAVVRADIDQASKAWQGLASASKTGRTDTFPGSTKKTAGGAPGVPNLETRFLLAVREHPQGISLAEAARILGANPGVLGRAAKKLVDEGKVRREDKTYFPTVTE